MILRFGRTGKKVGSAVAGASEKSSRFLLRGLSLLLDGIERAFGKAFDVADACGRVLFEILWFLSRLGMRREVAIPIGAVVRMLEDDLEGIGPCAWRMVGSDSTGFGFVVAVRSRKGAAALALRHGGRILE